MNYQELKLMIENLINSYKCNECKSNISENNIEIVGAAGSSVNIDITCPSCKKHAMVKSQVLHIDPNNISSIKQNLLNLKTNTKIDPKNIIKDEEVVKLSKDLKSKNITATDLFSEEKE